MLLKWVGRASPGPPKITWIGGGFTFTERKSFHSSSGGRCAWACASTISVRTTDNHSRKVAARLHLKHSGTKQSGKGRQPDAEISRRLAPCEFSQACHDADVESAR